ncbi:MAG: hypothetical protein B6242_15315 [Anaerolineaceae bacterium 4572_78]|nr:MAG: hypothetical protein B6242_15315 [Anaerolineaceae bacterium 4572_78]
MIEVRKQQVKMRLKDVEDFQKKVTTYQKHFAEKIVLPAFLALGGFIDEAKLFCEIHVIAVAERIVWLIGCEMI